MRKKILIAVAALLVVGGAGLYGYYQAMVHGWIRYNEYDIRNTANACYAAWPERLYVIGTDGRIAYKGGMGPFEFDTDELEQFLTTLG